MRIRMAAGVVLAATSLLNAQQTRDVEMVAVAGRAEVSGVVTNEAGEPVRRAFVELSYSRRMWRQVVVTGTDGRFSFVNVPAGAYDLAATRPPFLPARYGATIPGGKGIALVLADAARVTDTRLTLLHGAVIAGRVSDERGEVSAGVVVRLLRRNAGGNGTAFERLDSSTSTNDRGEYRIFGLPPGEYLVTAALAGSSQPVNVRLTTQADIDRALQGQGRDSSALTTRNAPAGVQAPGPGATVRPPDATAPVYYPGTTNAALASVVTVGVGEERSQIDFQTQLIRTSQVRGTVASADGALPDGLFVTMVPSAFTRGAEPNPVTVPVRPDGTFSFAGVPPGDYLIAAGPGSRITITSEGASHTFGVNAPAGAADAPVFGASSLRVDGADVSDVTVTIQRGVDVTGRLAMAGALPASAPPISVVLKPAEEVSQIVRQPFGGRPNGATGRFEIPGITPGRYRIGVAIPLVAVDPLVPPSWTLRSVTLRGKDVTDLPFDIARDGQPIDLTVTMTDRLSSLRGRFQDAAARPVTEFSVVLFAADRAFWNWKSRRVLSARPSSDGNFLFPDVPPGEYLLAAAAGLEADEWFDAGLLQQLTGAAIRVVVAEGEKTIQDIALPK
jgi:hypothetical protein